MSRDFVGALLQLNAEKQVPQEALIRAVEEGIQAAYRRVAAEEDIFVRIEPATGEIRVFRGRYVVDQVEDPSVQVTVDEARETRADARAGDVIETEQLDADHFGRIGAQTAKQIILQRMREVERDQVFDQFASREGELITGSVGRVEPRAIILDVGKGVEAVLATTEQSPLEHYRIGQPVKAFVLEVRRSARGPQIMVSRTHKGFLRRLFELEVPEIHAGTVEIKAIAREAGSRSKVAVSSRQEGLDPVGATVGQRGARVQAVVAELAGEKIDVIPWNEDASVFVANALSPAQVLGVTIDEEHRIATVIVPERMLSLAIGREGQNARLAARLTGWRIDIRSDTAAAEAAQAPVVAAVSPAAGEPSAAETTGSPTRRSRRGAGRSGQAAGREDTRGGVVVGPTAAGRTRPAPPRRLPERSCVACRTTRPKRELVRVVRAPDGSVAVDATGRAPGRGAYLLPGRVLLGHRGPEEGHRARAQGRPAGRPRGDPGGRTRRPRRRSRRPRGRA